MPPLIALVDADVHTMSRAAGDDLRRIAEVARQIGVPTFDVPLDFDAVGGADNALWRVPCQEAVGIWVGCMMPDDAYARLYDALRHERRITLINDPDQHRRAEELDRWYPYLQAWTPHTVLVTHPDQIEDAIAAVGLPAFLRGAVQSLKREGAASCRADTVEDARRLVARLLRHEARTRGCVAVRAWVELRHDALSPLGLPAAREFRAFVLHGEPLSIAPYWPDPGPLGRLDAEELARVRGLAVRAAEALDVPWIAVDVAQDARGGWLIVEVADAQFAGVQHNSPFTVLQSLREGLGSTG